MVSRASQLIILKPLQRWPEPVSGLSLDPSAIVGPRGGEDTEGQRRRLSSGPVCKRSWKSMVSRVTDVSGKHGTCLIRSKASAAVYQQMLSSRNLLLSSYMEMLI